MSDDIITNCGLLNSISTESENHQITDLNLTLLKLVKFMSAFADIFLMINCIWMSMAYVKYISRRTSCKHLFILAEVKA